MANKKNQYERLSQIEEDFGGQFIINALLNYFDSVELEEFVEFLEDEVNNF